MLLQPQLAPTANATSHRAGSPSRPACPTPPQSSGKRGREDEIGRDEVEAEDDDLQRAVALSLTAGQPSQTQENGAVVASSSAGVAPSSQPVAEAEESCLICLEGCNGETSGRPCPREHLRGWGYTPCCGSSFHFECLSTWLLDKDEVESSRGPVALPTYCPGCRSTRLASTSSRMLQTTRA